MYKIRTHTHSRRNLIYSVCRFRQISGVYPSHITMVFVYFIVIVCVVSGRFQASIPPTFCSQGFRVQSLEIRDQGLEISGVYPFHITREIVFVFFIWYLFFVNKFIQISGV